MITCVEVLKEYAAADLSKLRHRGDLKSLLASLSDVDANDLGRILSKGRKNGVFDRIKSFRGDWKRIIQPVTEIALGRSNNPPAEPGAFLR
jgi:hypothetical protein